MDKRQRALYALNRHYGDRWNIRITESLWVATARNSDGATAPTIIEPTLERFIHQLEFPPTGIGRPFARR